MPLPESGTITLDQIHVEVGGATQTTASIDDADIRALTNKLAGTTNSFDEYYGRSATPQLIQHVNVFAQQNMDLGGIFSATTYPSFAVEAGDILFACVAFDPNVQVSGYDLTFETPTNYAFDVVYAGGSSQKAVIGHLVVPTSMASGTWGLGFSGGTRGSHVINCLLFRDDITSGTRIDSAVNETLGGASSVTSGRIIVTACARTNATSISIQTNMTSTLFAQGVGDDAQTFPYNNLRTGYRILPGGSTISSTMYGWDNIIASYN